MKIDICHKLRHLVMFILSLFLLWLRSTSATSLGRQMVAAGGRGGNYKCIDNERHVLLHFKASVQDSYGCLYTWKHEQEATSDCCNWNGVTCNNQTDHVTSLNLSNGRIGGKISLSLLNLSYLNHLDLSGNELYITLSDSIGSLTELRYIDLSGNRIDETISKSIGSLTELMYLNLQNTFWGESGQAILTSISFLTRLRYLDLSLNSFNESIPMFIGSMTQLTHLDLSFNSFHGTIPKFIGSMAQLRHLDLSSNAFHGTIPMFTDSMTQLRHLDLSDNSFHGTIPKSIGTMTQLRYLDLSRNFFNGTIPLEFGNITNLQDLYLANLGGCTIENLDWVSRLSHLEGLDMSGIPLAKQNHWVNVILSLHKLSRLTLTRCDLSQVTRPYFLYANSSSSISYLDLEDNNLNSSMYDWLFPLTSNRLVDLDLSYNKLDGIPRYLGNLCSLTELDIRNNHIAFKFSDFLYNLSGCTSATLQWLYGEGSWFTGSLSDDIQKFSSLILLDFSNNQLNGTISDKVWELPNLQYLDLSYNSLEWVPSKVHMSNLSHMMVMNLRSCKLGPGFPKWIQKLENLSQLDISNTSISDTIPREVWKMWSSRLMHLDLSSNNITGKVTNLLSNFDSAFLRINLSSNNFYGPVGNVPSTLTSLDLSKNNFYGGISFLCQIVDGYLTFLDLSQNSFTGIIPDCLWHFKGLNVLILGQNNLFGRLPASVEYLINLEVLDLHNNNFSGELPLSLKNCTKLTFLELKGNKFSGYVPIWIGEELSRLYVLSLTSNNFFGTIPLQLCHLVNLHILNLSMNKLYGTIPPCLNNLNAMAQEGLSPHPNVHHLNGNVSSTNEHVDYVTINWQGIIREFRNTLGLVKSIDLSGNNLTGSIPYELTNLHELLVLNLSMNALHGEIPPKIGLMKKLLQLDLSRNNLSGRIPASMSQMTSLDYLDISCNNLSGRIPSSTQLQSFDPSRYIGNRLCGPPITKHCPGDKELDISHVIGESEDGGEGINELKRWFYIGGATGFATGFWIACGALLVNRRGRNAFFHLFDSLQDWVYVKVMVLVAKWQRVAHA